MKYGYLYQGQRYAWQKKRRGTPALGPARAAFVTFLQNHDQVANSRNGLRDAPPDRAPAGIARLTALLLLAPGNADALPGAGVRRVQPVPLLRRPPAGAGRSWCARAGRSSSSSSPASPRPRMQAPLPDPADPRTFRALQARPFGADSVTPKSTPCTATCCGCAATTPSSAPSGRAASTAPCSRPRRSCSASSATTATTGCCSSTWAATCISTRRPEPLLAPPEDTLWDILWSSEDPRYGGSGTAPPETRGELAPPGPRGRRRWRRGQGSAGAGDARLSHNNEEQVLSVLDFTGHVLGQTHRSEWTWKTSTADALGRARPRQHRAAARPANGW